MIKMVVEILLQSGKERYVNWHKNNALIDLKDAENIISISPKWSIIAGYYAIHNATKYYLGNVHNKEIKQPGAHKDAFLLLKKALMTQPAYNEVNVLIKKAEEEYEILIGADAESIYRQYERGKNQRENQQYYQTNFLKVEDAKDFLENTVKPFLKIILELKS